MKHSFRLMVLLISLGISGAATAYTKSCESSDVCKVYCNEGPYVGTMYWNGTRWSDGVRSDPDSDVVARAMVAAQGSGCA